MRIIGLTGGIGSGKSLVGRVFETLHVPVFRADDAGRHVLDSDEEVKRAVAELIGVEAYANGVADRKYIASIVFRDEKKLQALNQIIHPAVGRAFQTWILGLRETDYCIREAAILFESGTDQDCDRVICVSASEEVRIQRVTERDGVSASDVKARMAKQMPQDEKEERSDFVIRNDGLHPVIPQVIGLHAQLQVAG